MVLFNDLKKGKAELKSEGLQEARKGRGHGIIARFRIFIQI